MGWNTTVVVLHDALGDIARDPDFGKKLVAAINALDPCSRRGVNVAAGRHANAAHAIETHDADETALVATGGNIGARIFIGGPYAIHTKEGQWDLLEDAYQASTARQTRS